MRPEQQSPKEVKVDMSMHWPPEATHDSVVVVVGFVVEIIDSQVPKGGVQLRPDSNRPGEESWTCPCTGPQRQDKTPWLL